jgi:hypothetical protein
MKEVLKFIMFVKLFSQTVIVLNYDWYTIKMIITCESDVTLIIIYHFNK